MNNENEYKEEIGNIQLYHGEALATIDKLIADGITVDAIITVPPYGTTQCKWDSVIPMDSMWDKLNHIIKPNGAVVLFGSEPFSSMLRMSNIKNYKYDWVWEKTTATGHLNAYKQPMRAYENILVFYKSQPTYNPIKTQGHERKKSSSLSRAKSIERAKGRTKVYNNGCSKKVKDYDSTERFPRNVIKFSTDKQKSKLHPTQKPVALMEYLIKTYTNEKELVLDFTMGSGTTAIACQNTNRSFIGIEMDDEYFEIAKQRIEEHIKK